MYVLEYLLYHLRPFGLHVEVNSNKKGIKDRTLVTSPHGSSQEPQRLSTSNHDAKSISLSPPREANKSSHQKK